MSGFIYGLCAIAAMLCSYLLLRSYSRSKSRLLLWSGLCFLGLAVNNLLLIVDRIIITSLDLSSIRLVPALIGMMLLIYGLIWETD
ncbi:MAG: DUF5985 family protein [Candidatus Omnitrophica bacterium]|nr:DUF5985 family protein [Candidatus Omnitrophota bacterium]